MKNESIPLTFFALSLMLFSCATFSKKDFRKELIPLEETELSELSGRFSVQPVKKHWHFRKEDPDGKDTAAFQLYNAYYFLTNTKENTFNLSKRRNADYFLQLMVRNTDSLQVQLVESSRVISETVLAGKLKNGMFNIDNAYLSCNGIPYLFGGCRNNKRRIGVTKSGNLLINEAVSNEGALLLIIGSGYNYNVTYEYERK